MHPRRCLGDVYLTYTGVHLAYKRVPHGHASHGRASHRRASLRARVTVQTLATHGQGSREEKRSGALAAKGGKQKRAGRPEWPPGPLREQREQREHAKP
jgi:hypothetical protein